MHPADRVPPCTKHVVLSEIHLTICDTFPVTWVASLSHCAIQIIETLDVQSVVTWGFLIFPRKKIKVFLSFSSPGAASSLM